MFTSDVRLVLAIVATLLHGAPAMAVMPAGNDPHSTPASSSRHISEAQLLPDATRLLGLFRNRQFAVLETTLNDRQSAYERDTSREEALRLAFATFFLADPDAEPLFEDWMQRFPASYAAHLASGIYYYAIATTWRGDKYANKTHRARTERMRQFMEKAEERFRQSLQQVDKPILSLTYLIYIAKYTGSRQQARFWLDQAVALDPHCEYPRMAYMGALEPRWGGSHSAMRSFAEETAAIGKHPKLSRIVRILNGQVFWDQGYSRFLRGDYVEALRLFEQAIAESDWSYFLATRGRLYQRVGQTELALADLSAALTRNPHSADAYLWRALALLDKRRTDEAITDLQSAALRGNTYAMTRLGHLYADGEHGVPVQIEEALRWWGKAAHFWDENALFALGKTYERGLGVRMDHAKAVKYYRIAADQGHGAAQNDLGLMLWYGRGTEADQKEAVRLWLLAAKRGIWQARHNLNFFLDPVEWTKIAVTHPRALFTKQTLLLAAITAGVLFTAIVVIVLRRKHAVPVTGDMIHLPGLGDLGPKARPDMTSLVPGKTYRAGMARQRVAGFIATVLFLACATLAWRSGETDMAPWFLFFVALGLYAFLTTSEITLDSDKISLRSVIGHYRIRWAEVLYVETGVSGTLVLHGIDKRLVLPAPAKWSGPEKSVMLTVLFAELSRRGLRVTPGIMADFKTNKNTRA